MGLRPTGHQQDPVPLERFADLEDSMQVADTPDVLAINEYFHQTR
jgi:hypothetical protein